MPCECEVSARARTPQGRHLDVQLMGIGEERAHGILGARIVEKQERGARLGHERRHRVVIVLVDDLEEAVDGVGAQMARAHAIMTHVDDVVH